MINYSNIKPVSPHAAPEGSKVGDFVAQPEGGCANCMDGFEPFQVQKGGVITCYACGYW